jgi:digeranylgeranylglycerophospholipid reductase
MKHDVIVIGGGPGGLMAAKTAAEDGLKVILIERKRHITEVNRACGQMIYIGGLDKDEDEPEAAEFIDPVSIEIAPGKCRFLFPSQGFSLDYDGPLKPYYNFIYVSPSGYQIHRYQLNNKIWGFYFQKEAFLAGLLASVEKAGAEVWAETSGLEAENTPDGVKVRVRQKSGDQTLEARMTIAADGLRSRVVDSLGFDRNRQVLGPLMKVFTYEMEGMQINLPELSSFSTTIPSINPFWDISIGVSAGNTNMLATVTVSSLLPSLVIEKFMKHPTFAPWFRRARVIKKTAATITPRSPIREPVAGNVVIIGDAAAPIETTIKGAAACGYQAVKAIEKELNGQKGYLEYIDWWQNAFYFNKRAHSRATTRVYPLRKLCSDEEVDYIYKLFQGKVGIPEKMVANNLELIKQGRPELYEKLTKGKR